MHLTQNHFFPRLIEISKVNICEVSFLANGYKKDDLSGLKDNNFVTQARNAEMVEDCDHYLTL